jgi:hypothetical protein
MVKEMYANQGLESVSLTYVDEDGDTITIGSEAEFKEGLFQKFLPFV